MCDKDQKRQLVSQSTACTAKDKLSSINSSSKPIRARLRLFEPSFEILLPSPSDW